MKATLKSVLTMVVIPLVIAFAIEVLSPFAPETLPALQRWVTSVTEWVGFPWVLAGSLGLLVGMWLDRWAGSFDGRHPIGRRAKATAMAGEVGRIGRLCASTADPGFISISRDPNTVVVEGTMIIAKLERIGVQLLRLEGAPSQKELLRYFGSVFSSIEAPLREGDIALAQDVADAIGSRQAGQGA